MSDATKQFRRAVEYGLAKGKRNVIADLAPLDEKDIVEHPAAFSDGANRLWAQAQAALAREPCPASQLWRVMELLVIQAASTEGT